MKFDVFVGNPPYQMSDGGAQVSAKPIYHRFIQLTKSLNPQYLSMIVPARWYSGGKGLDEFRDEMLNDDKISELHDFLNPEQLFPNTNIRGGICYFLRDNRYDNKKSLTKVVTHQANSSPFSVFRSLMTEHSDTFIRHGIAISVIEKIKKHSKFIAFEKYISARKPFGLDGLFINNEKFRSTKKGLKIPIICYGRGKKIGYMEKDDISTNKLWIDRFKVFTPYANNIGTELNDDNLNTFIGEPGTICTETYIVIGAELKLEKNSANNLTKYFSTKFVRFQHSLAKASQHATSKTYQFVPLQNFTTNSDIDWSKPISEIDQQLYAKYNLSKEEIAFIESMIKVMG